MPEKKNIENIPNGKKKRNKIIKKNESLQQLLMFRNVSATTSALVIFGKCGTFTDRF